MADRESDVCTPPRGAVLVLPLARTSQPGPVAAWATTGGWAQGAEQVLGAAWVLTDSGVLSPTETSESVAPAVASSTTPSLPRLSGPTRTLAKDVRRAIVGRTRARRLPAAPWHDREVVFVWQRHTLFRRCGLELAAQLKAPLVLSVHGMQVEEASNWGVKRPGWARAAERIGELPQLRRADLVACVSDEVAEAVAERGIRHDRILVTPNGVDAEHFQPRAERDQLRRELGLDGCFVIGWSGSFRSFHGLDLALAAMRELRDTEPDVRLLLMGDGPHRAHLELRAEELGLKSVHFPGSISYASMPRHLSACDVGLVLSEPGTSFHYSPVKLREYMACGLPVISHARGEMAAALAHGRQALLVAPDDLGALVRAIRRLRTSERLRAELSRNAREYAVTNWTWTRPVERTLDALRANRSI